MHIIVVLYEARRSVCGGIFSDSVVGRHVTHLSPTLRDDAAVNVSIFDIGIFHLRDQGIVIVLSTKCIQERRVEVETLVSHIDAEGTLCIGIGVSAHLHVVIVPFFGHGSVFLEEELGTGCRVDSQRGNGIDRRGRGSNII